MAETFLSSIAVQVYPCAYRGTNAEGKLYNPEAQLNTEFNLTNTKNINGRKSWVISWEETSKKLKCVIGGYYFDLDLSTPLGTSGILKDSTDIYAYIKVLPMGTVDSANTQYPAYTLSDVSETGATTTGKILDDGGEFKGVKLADSIPNGKNIVGLHVLHKSSTGWLVDSDDWSLTTDEIIDTATQSRLSFDLTTVHLNGVETGEIEELKVDKVQSYLTSQIDFISDVKIPTLGVDIITTREVYIDNAVVQVASQSQDLVSNLSKSGVTTLNKETTGQYHLTGSELTSHSLLLGNINSNGTIDPSAKCELSAEGLSINYDVGSINNVNLTPYSIAFMSSEYKQHSSALTTQAIQFKSSDDGVTTYRVDSITRKLEDSNSSPTYTLKIPSKSGTLATLDDFMGGSINTVTPGSDGTVKLFGDNPPTKTQSYVTFTLRILLPSNNSISLGTLCLKNDTTKYSFLCGYLSKQKGGTNYLYNGYAILIDTFDDWKLTLLKSVATGSQDVYTPYTVKNINIEVSDYTEHLVKQK